MPTEASALPASLTVWAGPTRYVFTPGRDVMVGYGPGCDIPLERLGNAPQPPPAPRSRCGPAVHRNSMGGHRSEPPRHLRQRIPSADPRDPRRPGDHHRGSPARSAPGLSNRALGRTTRTSRPAGPAYPAPNPPAPPFPPGPPPGRPNEPDPRIPTQSADAAHARRRAPTARRPAARRRRPPPPGAVPPPAAPPAQPPIAPMARPAVEPEQQKGPSLIERMVTSKLPRYSAPRSAPRNPTPPIACRCRPASRTTGMTAYQLGLTVDGHETLSAISFTARPGTMTAVIGPSAARNSALLALLAGTRAPQLRARHRGRPRRPRRAGVHADPHRGRPARRPSAPAAHRRADRAVCRRNAAATGHLARATRPRGQPGSRRTRADVAPRTPESANSHPRCVGAPPWRSSSSPGRVCSWLTSRRAGLDAAQQRQLMAMLRRQADIGCAVVVAISDRTSLTDVNACDQVLVLTAAGKVAYRRNAPADRVRDGHHRLVESAVAGRRRSRRSPPRVSCAATDGGTDHPRRSAAPGPPPRRATQKPADPIGRPAARLTCFSAIASTSRSW